MTPLEITSPTIWTKRFWWCVLCLLAFRIVYAWWLPLNLAPDESYYWDWSRIPDWGYYSKPPMVAWLNYLTRTLLGVSEFRVRLPAVLLGTLGLIPVFLLTRRLFGDRAGFWAAVLSVATPGSCALSLVMTIDPPLMFCWAASLWSIWRALETRQLRWYVWAGLFTGLGVLSKQMMLVLPVIVIVFMMLSPTRWQDFRRLGIYLYLAIALFALTPVLWWNAQHDWITVAHTGENIAARSHGWLHSAVLFFEFIGGQLGLLSPITVVLLLGVGISCLKDWRQQPEPIRLLVLSSIVPLLVFTVFSVTRRVNANWPAVYYTAGVVLLAGWGTGAFSCQPWIERWRSLFFPGIWLGLAMAGLTYSVPVLLPMVGLDGADIDPTHRLRGWDQLGAETAVIIQQLPEPENTILISPKRQIVSSLAFYVPGNPRVYRWPGPENIVDSQYELWLGPQKHFGKHGLVVIEGSPRLPEGIERLFDTLELHATRQFSLGTQGQRTISFFYGKNLHQWP